jgi:hypothetical protein
MRRRDFLAGSGGSLLSAARPSRLLAFSTTLAPLDEACASQSTLAAVPTFISPRNGSSHPSRGIRCFLLWQAGGRPALVEMSQLLAHPAELAYNHVILIGRPDDPLLTAASQREACFSSGGVYVFGFGAFRGDCGYIESDRNPFLHAARISSAPYETELITITGTSDQGIRCACSCRLRERFVVQSRVWLAASRRSLLVTRWTVRLGLSICDLVRRTSG